MSPKVDLPSGATAPMRTTSPGLRNGVRTRPYLSFSTVRASAMQPKPMPSRLMGRVSSWRLETVPPPIIVPGGAEAFGRGDDGGESGGGLGVEKAEAVLQVIGHEAAERDIVADGD